MWKVAQNVQGSFLAQEKIRLDFLRAAYIADSATIQNYRRALPNSKKIRTSSEVRNWVSPRKTLKSNVFIVIILNIVCSSNSRNHMEKC